MPLKTVADGLHKIKFINSHLPHHADSQQDEIQLHRELCEQHRNQTT